MDFNTLYFLQILHSGWSTNCIQFVIILPLEIYIIHHSNNFFFFFENIFFWMTIFFLQNGHFCSGCHVGDSKVSPGEPVIRNRKKFRCHQLVTAWLFLIGWLLVNVNCKPMLLPFECWKHTRSHLNSPTTRCPSLNALLFELSEHGTVCSVFQITGYL